MGAIPSLRSIMVLPGVFVARTRPLQNYLLTIGFRWLISANLSIFKLKLVVVPQYLTAKIEEGLYSYSVVDEDETLILNDATGASFISCTQ